jgi:protein gp37
MSKVKTIHQCKSTSISHPNCSSCEHYKSADRVTRDINSVVKARGFTIDSRAILKDLIDGAYQKIKNPGPGHRNAVTTTNIWHFRDPLCQIISDRYGHMAGLAALAAIKKLLKCYAAKLHLNRGANLLRPDRKIKNGYAPSFEQVTNFAGRMASAACWKDLRGSTNPATPWKYGLPRMVFISDMGDSLCSKSQRQFDFLRREVIGAAVSEKGLRHLWLWLTKRPLHMRDFAEYVGGLPANICAMTSVTGVETLYRVDDLRQVRAACRGLSIEPLWERIPSKDLDLRGIDWVIVGGESGSGDLTRPFHVEWAEELRDHCRKNGVAFFMKQLGRNPVVAGKPIRLSDPHGGEWDEWPRNLRIREFPNYFHQYRAGEGKVIAGMRPA